MGIRLLAAGVASLAMIGMLAAMLRVSSQTQLGRDVRASTSEFDRLLNQARESPDVGTETGWSVTKANSAHRALVVEVEAERLEDARAIGLEIVAPVRSRGYEEILIYVRLRGAGAEGPTRRIQWTPRRGFVETGY